MNTSIQCPHCRHFSRTRFGLIVKAHIRYEWNYESLWGFGSSLNYLNSSWHYARGKNYDWWVFLQKKKALLGFWCRHCKKSYPDEMTPEILEFLRLNRLLNKLKKA